MHPPLDTALAQTRAWVDRAVIGLNLCPFAKAVQVKRLIRFVASDATDVPALREHLRAELLELARTPADVVETTVLVHPWVLQDFIDFQRFVAEGERLVRKLRLDGTLQLAAFHPHYQFADAPADDPGHRTNQSPHPTLHLIREASIDRAVAAFAEPESIYEANIRTLQQLGDAGWQRLQAGWTDAVAPSQALQGPEGPAAG